MHDPASSAGSPDGVAPGSGPDVTSHVAMKMVTRVIAWYAQQILAEQRLPSPDLERLQQLQESRRGCVADLDRLADADVEEIGRIAADYEARLKKLTTS
ncbi:hypothetical protein ACMATS_37825 (plasmid) [Streptoverticillium reticulum]|uniref:hypothetical protein n=1 Tax=Streptoverticillium reticulum TaxID=1433415 RepID=UPI0039BFEF0A